MYDVLSQISYLANALTIIRKRIFKLQISNFLAARARLFAKANLLISLCLNDYSQANLLIFRIVEGGMCIDQLSVGCLLCSY